jgi:enolase
MVSKIKHIGAREILDSRGNPTIEVEVITDDGFFSRAAVPSGASTGIYEAMELRDNNTRYHGKGVQKAVETVEKIISPKLKGLQIDKQSEIDHLMIEMDGTENKSKLGGNTILGVSLAIAKAAASSECKKLFEYVNPESRILPVPFFNVINGGKHAGNQLDFQEFMIAPVGAKNFKEALRIGSEIYHELESNLLKDYGKNAINVGDEGGFSPPMKTPEEAFESILLASEEMGYNDKTVLALDVAASSFYKGLGYYTYEGEDVDTQSMIDLYSELVSKYPIKSIEDPLEEEDYEGFVEVTKTLNIQILGDDLFVTNKRRLWKGIEMGACNALLWKVNQIGTLTEALEAATLAQNNGYNVMASHRSGDTEDPFVSDLSVALECGQIKSGAPCRGERTAKYNQLLRIEEWLGNKAVFPKNPFFK